MTPDEGMILLVEDNQDDVDLTLRALARHNVANEVTVVRDGAEALDFVFARGQYSSRDPSALPRLILLDINLPKLSGLQVLQELRSNQLTRMVPVVMLTTSSQERDVVDSYTHGANSYVQKPIDFQEFAEAVKQLGVYWLLVNQTP
jgi:two-component system response regulator